MAEQNKALTPTQKLKNTTLSVQSEIDKYCKDGKLNLPVNYSVGNALKQAQLKIQDTPELMECTQASLAKCLLDMAVLGLNVSKQQAYMIPYGGRAQLSVSYMGKVAIAKRIDPTIETITARVVKEGEEFEFNDTDDGYSIVTKHKRTLQSLKSKNIEAAYATIVYNDNKPNKSLIMTFDRIKQSWKQSQLKPVNDDGTLKKGTTHEKFTEEMCCRTVISAICKGIINTSDDADLFGSTVQAVSLEENKAQADAEASEKMGSGDVVDVDVDFSEVPDVPDIDKETGEILE